MRNQSLIDDLAFGLSKEIMTIFELLMDEEERFRVWAVVYQTVKAAVECYEESAERRVVRLNPSKN